MNIAVYVTSNYSNYDEFSKLLPKYLSKYTQSPVLLTANSRSTKDGHGNKLVKKYADEHNLKCKVYETEWNKWRKSAGSIASYHLNHNSEHSIVFWDGMSKGCKNVLQMAVRLNRPCDLVRINPSYSNIKKEQPKPDTVKPQQNIQPTLPSQPTKPSVPSVPTSSGDTTTPTAAVTPSASTNTNTNTPVDTNTNTTSEPAVGTEAPTSGQPTVNTSDTPKQANVKTDDITKEFVKNAATLPTEQSIKPQEDDSGTAQPNQKPAQTE